MSEFAFHPEDKARLGIDQSLAARGWIVQSKSDMNLGAGPGIAVREFQTDSGPVDYALFVGRILCGVVEAKPAGTILSGFSEQAACYSQLDRTVLVPNQIRTGAGGVGVGVETADMLAREVFSRPLRDRKAVARYAGLTGAPDESGQKR